MEFITEYVILFVYNLYRVGKFPLVWSKQIYMFDLLEKYLPISFKFYSNEHLTTLLNSFFKEILKKHWEVVLYKFYMNNS